MKLNKRQKEAFQFLKYLCECYLNGQSPNVNGVDFNKLNEIGVNVNRVNHRRVKSLVRGKDLRMERVITNAPWYIKGKSTYEYLPFQVKEYRKSD